MEPTFSGPFVDSDYAANETRRATMGIVTMMNGGPISCGAQYLERLWLLLLVRLK
jgi:hypothetical protein